MVTPNYPSGNSRFRGFLAQSHTRPSTGRSELAAEFPPEEKQTKEEANILILARQFYSNHLFYSSSKGLTCMPTVDLEPSNEARSTYFYVYVYNFRFACGAVPHTLQCNHVISALLRYMYPITAMACCVPSDYF